MPAEVEFVASNPGSAAPAPSCAPPAGRDVVCDLDDIAAGAAVTVLVSVRITDPTTDTTPAMILNEAVVSTESPEDNLENNTAEEQTSLTRNDLEIVKSDHPDPLEVPGWLTYTLVITNHGPCDDPNPRVTDTLPAEFIYRGSTTSHGTVGYIPPPTHTVTATLGVLQSTQAATVTITGTVPCINVNRDIDNSAVVSGTYVESDLWNNRDVEATVISGTICADLGDTPDSHNQSGIPMTAYPGVGAEFPTVFNRSGGQPPGPKHIQAKDDAWLGSKLSGEEEADAGPDEDSGNNIDPLPDIPNHDGHDDGIVQSQIPIPNCNATLFTYKVTVTDVLQTAPRQRFTNVWIDFNRDGDWNDNLVCIDPTGQPMPVSEWAVRDDPSNLGPGVHDLSTPPFGAMAPPSLMNPMWMRITLSDTPSPSAGDGRGPTNGYMYGETEDYLLDGGAGGGPAPFVLDLRRRSVWSVIKDLLVGLW